MAALIASLVLRILAFIFLLTSLILLATNNATVVVNDVFTSETQQAKLRFTDVYAYRYLIAAIAVGFLCNFLQLGLNIYRLIAKGTRENTTLQYTAIFGDMVIAYVLATGSAAGFGVTKDLKGLLTQTNNLVDMSKLESFFNKGYATSALVLAAFVFIAISQIVSVLALSKRA